MESKPYIIKLNYNNDLRRISFQKSELNFAGLQSNFVQLYPELAGLPIQFEVAGDVPVVITNEDEFSAALAKHSSTSSNRVFQITAKVAPSSQNQPQNTNTSTKPTVNEPKKEQAKPTVPDMDPLKQTANTFLQGFLGFSPTQADELSNQGLGMFTNFLNAEPQKQREQARTQATNIADLIRENIKCYQTTSPNTTSATASASATITTNPVNSTKVACSSPTTNSTESVQILLTRPTSSYVSKAMVEAKRTEFTKQKPQNLKLALNKLGVSCDDVVEKQELVSLLLEKLGWIDTQKILIPINFKTEHIEEEDDETWEEEEELPAEVELSESEEEGQQEDLLVQEDNKEEFKSETNESEKVEEQQQSVGVPPLVQKLKTLESLGFQDRSANIKALIASQGDVAAAVEMLVSPFL